MNSTNIEVNAINLIVKKYKSAVMPNVVTLENEILKGRDRKVDPIPIYLTRRRIKKVNSVYLKLKRKPEEYEKLEDIKDYAGLKVLCLFEQDIFPTHEHLLNVFKDQEYNMEECLIINWNKIDYRDLKEYFKKKVKEIFKLKAKEENRESKYRSIHYIINKGFGESKYFIEIQLRTLFQDVWAELEHTLVYKKGNVHPHIRKSFNLLAQNIETNDLLISHLKDISDKEGIGRKYLLENIGPHKWFDYEPELISDLFKIGGLCHDKYNEYINFISSKTIFCPFSSVIVSQLWAFFNIIFNNF